MKTFPVESAAMVGQGGRIDTASCGNPRRGLAGRVLWADRRGSIVIMSSLCLVLLVGAAAVAIDLANVYLTKSADQRIADQSAIAAAFAYGQSNSSTSTAQLAASSLATANGVSGANGASISTTIINSPKNNGNKAAMVVVTTPVSLTPFGQSASALANVTVGATAYAEIHDQSVPCFQALGASGFSDSGGTSITATGCSIASTGSVSAAQGASVTAQAIYAVGSIGTSGGATIQTSPTSGQLYSGSSAEPDPYASSGVFSRQTTVAALTAASFPSVGSAPSGGSSQTCAAIDMIMAGQHGTVTTSYFPTCSMITFMGGASETDVSGSGLSLTGNNVTISFMAGVYKINGITISGSTAVTINVASGVTLDIWNGIVLNGSTSLTVNGPGTYNIQGGISNSGSGSVTFNNSNSSTTTSIFNIAGGISGGSGTMTFPNGTYTITSGDGTAGIDLGSGTITFGNGSFNIAGGISVGGSGQLTFGSQLNGNAVFQIDTVANNGNAITTGGGSTLTLGSFTNFDINGAVVVAGNVALGAGAYTIEGAFNASASGGSSITGTGVSIVTSGAISVGAGYSTINLSAPTTITNTTQGTSSTVVLASTSSTSSVITSGATNTVLVGGVYMPNAPLSLSGSAHLSGGGGCLILVANSVTLSAGGTAATNCTGVQSTVASGVALVQ